VAAHLATYSPLAYAQVQPAQPVPYQPAPAPVPYGPVPGAVPGSAPPAAAQAARPSVASAGTDAIYLKNGGMHRGTIIDAIPGSQARIQLATGEIATVPWSEVARIEHASAAPAAAPPVQPAQPAPSPGAARAPAGTEGGVLLHIESPATVSLQRPIPGTEGKRPDWLTVCTSPCDARVPPGRYRIAGDGVRPSGDFVVPATAQATLTVSPGSKGWFVGGIVLLSVGAPVLLVGLLIGAVSSIIATADAPNPTADDWAHGGWTAAFLGGAAMIAGIVGIANNSHSGVSFGGGDAAKLFPGSPWAPVATWREAPPEAKGLPAAVAVPLLRGTF
jgi:hypothetical protein